METVKPPAKPVKPVNPTLKADTQLPKIAGSVSLEHRAWRCKGVPVENAFGKANRKSRDCWFHCCSRARKPQCWGQDESGRTGMSAQHLRLEASRFSKPVKRGSKRVFSFTPLKVVLSMRAEPRCWEEDESGRIGMSAHHRLESSRFTGYISTVE